MRRIRSFSCLLLLSLSLLFLLLVSPCSCDPSLEADDAAVHVAPVEEDPIVSVTPEAQTPSSSSTTESSIPTLTDPDGLEESAAETDTYGPDPRSDQTSSDDNTSPEASSSTPSGGGEQPASVSSSPSESASAGSSEQTSKAEATSAESTGAVADAKTTELTSESSKVSEDVTNAILVTKSNEVTVPESNEVESSTAASSSVSTGAPNVTKTSYDNTSLDASSSTPSGRGEGAVSVSSSQSESTTARSSEQTSKAEANSTESTGAVAYENTTELTSESSKAFENVTNAILVTKSNEVTVPESNEVESSTAASSSVSTGAPLVTQASVEATKDEVSSSQPAALPAPSTTPPVVEFKIEYCGLPQDHGPCRNNDIMWWYDRRNGVCKEFYYGGCDGNNNRFVSRRDCEMKCWNSQDICKLKKIRGPCSGKFVQWYYDPESDQCLPFSYSGCCGNANRFSQKESCETQCKINHGSPVIPFPTPTERENRQATDSTCVAPVDPGSCRAYLSQYYYDVNENICRTFIYTGCGGNSNRFESMSQCESRCVASRGDDKPLTVAEKEIVCRLEADQGTCSETHARWFYDPTSFTCLPFVYTGCAGNKNRFKSFETCLKFCQAVSILIPGGVIDQPDDNPDDNRNNKPAIGRTAGPYPYPYPVFTTPSTTTTVSTTTQRDLCKYECSDSQYFADCELIVQNQFCSNPYYAKFCCKTCLLNNQLNMEKVKEVLVGPNNSNFHVLNDGTRICLFENTV